MARASGLTILSKLAKLAALIVITGVLAAGVLLPYVGGIGIAAKSGADKFLNTSCSLTEEPVQQKTTLMASDGKTVIATLFDQNRQVISLSKLPKYVSQALVGTEDRRFYQHHGVDVRGLVRAALHTSGGSTQGASTLTEQYVKQVNYYNAITSGDTKGANAAIDQNIDRKISDAQCALKLEKEYTKDQILEKYLNIAFFGENAYGIQTAAQTYFGIDASKLTVPEAALLVGLVRSPSYYDPYQDIKAAKARRDLVLDNMASANYLTQAQADNYKTAPIPLQKNPQPARGCANANKGILNAGFFCDYATSWLTSEGGFTAQRLNTGGLTIVTTLNANLQNSGQNAIWTQSGLDPAHANGYVLAMPSVNPANGEVTSMITDLHYGCYDQKKPSAACSVNPIFTSAYAGSGSTYKYFTALAALKAGVKPDFHLLTPSPYNTKNCPTGTDPTGGYHNAANYPPYMPLNQALPQSSNTYFVGMEDQFFGCDLGPIVNTATGLGMNYLTDKAFADANGRTVAQQVVQDHSATFTLGQFPTSALELTGAMSAVAHDGVFCPPTPIHAVFDAAGKPVPFKKVGCSQQYDPYVARTLLNIMTNDTNPAGTGGTAQRYFSNWYANGGSLVAGKTGTNNSAICSGGKCVDDKGNSALWFVGITPSLVSAAALVNPNHPNQKIQNVPGVTANNDGTDTFGAAAAQFWLQAYGPSLAAHPWTWPTVDQLPGDALPANQIIGQDPQVVMATLTGLGYKPVVAPYYCGSNYPAGMVAYFSPAKAVTGATITLCRSSGSGVTQLYIPPPSQPSKPKPSPTGGGGGGGNTPAPTPSKRPRH